MLCPELKQKIINCAKENNLKFYSWGSRLPKGSIVYKQVEDTALSVQVYVPERRGYDDYAKIKSDLSAILLEFNLCLVDDCDLDKTISGWYRQLQFKLDETLQKTNDGKGTSISKSFRHISDNVFDDNMLNARMPIAKATNYKALVIGVNEYQNSQSYSNLKAVLNDVDALSKLLFSSPCDYQTALIKGKRATYDKIMKELAHFFDSENDDILFLYWAGHGTGSNFIAYDTDPNQENKTAIEINMLSDMIENTLANAVFVVLDCCYSGAIARSKSESMLDIKGDGKVIMASSDYYEQSFESTDLGHGNFSYHFIKGLKGEAALESGYVTVNSLYDYICENIANMKNTRKQTPVFKGTFAGKFVLNRMELNNNVSKLGRKTCIDNYPDNTMEKNELDINLFTFEELIILKVLSLDDHASVNINTSRTLSDHEFNIHIVSSLEKLSINLNPSATRREFTKWNRILITLSEKGLLEQIGYAGGKKFSLLEKGFIIAEMVNEDIIGEFTSVIKAPQDGSTTSMPFLVIQKEEIKSSIKDRKVRLSVPFVNEGNGTAIDLNERIYEDTEPLIICKTPIAEYSCSSPISLKKNLVSKDKECELEIYGKLVVNAPWMDELKFSISFKDMNKNQYRQDFIIQIHVDLSKAKIDIPRVASNVPQLVPEPY